MAAAERKAKYMDPPPPSEITDDLRIQVLRLWLEPQGDSAAVDGTIDLAASINHVVIRPEDRDEGVVQPLSFETEPVKFSNLFGAQFTSTRGLSTFSAEGALAASEDRDLEVVVITPAGERRCNVDNDDIKRMFQMDQ